MIYKIRECEELVTPNGKKYKKMVLKSDDQQNEEPRVTVWSDHPEYEASRVGGTINGTIQKKDSGTPIPSHPEKNYVNRTLLPETDEQFDAKVDETTNILSRLAELEAWAMSKGFIPKKLQEKEEVKEEEINPDDIPF